MSQIRGCFFRLKGCVPEWILEDEHLFSWKVVSLLGLYGGGGGVGREVPRGWLHGTVVC